MSNFALQSRAIHRHKCEIMTKKKMGMVIYRYNDNEDLEVFMVGEGDNMALPQTDFTSCDEFEAGTGIAAADNEDVFELEGEEYISKPRVGLRDTAIALEAKMEEKMKKFLHIKKEEGNYIAMKEAVRKVIPHQYAILKELKDVLMERNLTKYL